MQVHQDALWMLENLGVGCRQPDIQNAFQKFEAQGQAVVYENRIYLTAELVEHCLSTVPGVADFFVPRNSFFIGGTAPYVYDDVAGCGGVIPTADHLFRIARIAEENPIVAGMGRGVKLKDEIEQMNIMKEELHQAALFCRNLGCLAGQSQGDSRAEGQHHDRFLPDPARSGSQ